MRWCVVVVVVFLGTFSRLVIIDLGFLDMFSTWWWSLRPLICTFVELLRPSSVVSCCLRGVVFFSAYFLCNGGDFFPLSTCGGGASHPLVYVWWSFLAPRVHGHGASHPFVYIVVEVSGLSSFGTQPVTALNA